jgi:hypothetical protein
MSISFTAKLQLLLTMLAATLFLALVISHHSTRNMESLKDQMNTLIILSKFSPGTLLREIITSISVAVL